MSREKQIEEMAEILASDCGDCKECEYYDGDYRSVINCCRKYANMLYNAGYRKQEWISVDERLPETLTTVLVYDTHTQSVRFGQYRITDELWYNGRITHWMPLPEAPKMKGGAE